MTQLPIRILALDDEPGLCELTKEFLNIPGEVEVDTATSAYEARAALAQRKYDAIISDYQMPLEDGIQFLKSLRAKGDMIPFILFTGKGREEVVIEALNFGADSYLQKGGDPIPQYAELIHRIREMVQRHQVERALRESEEQYRVIFDQSPIAIELYDANGSLIHANPSCLRMFGVESIQDVQGSSLFDDLNLSQENNLRLHRGAIIHYQGPFDFEDLRGHKLFPTNSKGVIWLDILITPLGISPEPITGYLVQILDITDRKMAMDHLQLAIEGSGVGLWDWNMQTGEAVYNERWAAMVGYTLEELSPVSIETWRQMVHPDDLVRSDALLEKYFSGQTPYYECEARMRHKEGGWIWVVNRGKVSSRDDQNCPKRMSGTQFEITERKLSEEMLRANEKKLKLITDNMQDAVWLLDMQLRPTWMSPSVFRNSGFTTEELASISIDRQMTSESFRKVTAAIMALMTPENLQDPTKDLSFTDELEYYRKDGSTQWIDVVFSLLRDETGRPAGVLGVGRDVTERIRAESELKSNQHLLSKILGTSPNLIYIYDLKEHRNLYANREVVEFLGYTPQQIVDMGASLFGTILHPDDAKVVAEHQETLCRSADGIIKVAEYRMRRSDGNWCWLRSRDVVFERDVDGSVRSELGIAEDVTERKMAAESVRQGEEKFRVVSQSSPDHIVIQDRDLRYVWVLNPQLGLSLGDMIGRTDYDILPKDEADRLTAVKKAVMSTGNDSPFSTSLASLNGSLEYFDGVIRPRYDSVGNIDGVIGYFRNVTETIHAQGALRNVNRKLNLLTSITRHDIKNQLLALTGYMSLLEGRGTDPLFEEHLRKAEFAADRISSMIEFTRTYEDLGVNDPIWQNVRTLVERCSKEHPLGDVRFENVVPDGIRVFADPLIVKVFCNLIDNSLRHGLTTTTIRFSMEEVDGVHHIVCEDDGVGVPTEMKGKIFERGSGKHHSLGLFLSREILSITGITITETGEKGKGARFEMAIPADGLKR